LNYPRSSKKDRENNLRAKIPAELIDAWQETIIENARFSRGTRVNTEKPETLVRGLAKSEKNTLIELWKTFTSEREQLNAKTLTGKKEAVAYLLGFHLSNSARIIHTFNAASKRWNIKDFIGNQEQVRIIDLGCGSGAMAQANVCFVKSAHNEDAKIQVQLVDGSSHLLDAAVSGLNKIDQKASVRAHKGDLAGLIVDKYVSDKNPFTFINLGYVWNEIVKNRSARQKISKLFSAVIRNETESLITVIEPGSQDQSRAAMELREELIEQGFMPLYPCPHSNSCPLLEMSRDWCYSEITWAHPPVQKFIDSQIGVERTVLAASAFLFASPALMKKLKPLAKDLEIVVGRPTRPSPSDSRNPSDRSNFGKKADYLLCTKEGIKKTPIHPNSNVTRRGDHLAVSKNNDNSEE